MTQNFKKTAEKAMTVSLLEIRQERPGFNGFIGSWLCRGRLNLLVDVGPANGAENLLSSLRERNIERIDYVLLTHIHLDHAGALASIVEAYPMARVIAHARALPHLVDPSSLWKGSREVLGYVAEEYGRPAPVDSSILIDHKNASVRGLKIIDTQGHAPHHLSFVYEDHLFSGEAAGNYFILGAGDYLRPATPPPFFYDRFIESVEALLRLPDMRICFGHLAMASSSLILLKRFQEQIVLWKEVIHDLIVKNRECTEEECMEALLEKDINLAVFQTMDEQEKIRERFFMSNSLRGFIGFLKK